MYLRFDDRYHHTCLPINVYGLREALAMITEEVMVDYVLQ